VLDGLVGSEPQPACAAAVLSLRPALAFAAPAARKALLANAKEPVQATHLPLASSSTASPSTGWRQQSTTRARLDSHQRQRRHLRLAPRRARPACFRRPACCRRLDQLSPVEAQLIQAVTARGSILQECLVGTDEEDVPEAAREHAVGCQAVRPRLTCSWASAAIDYLSRGPRGERVSGDGQRRLLGRRAAPRRSVCIPD